MKSLATLMPPRHQIPSDCDQNPLQDFIRDKPDLSLLVFVKVVEYHLGIGMGIDRYRIPCKYRYRYQNFRYWYRLGIENSGIGIENLGIGIESSGIGINSVSII